MVGPVRPRRRALRRFDRQAPRRVLPLAERGGKPQLGPAVERGGDRAPARSGGGTDGGGPETRAANGPLLLVHGVVQSALAYRPPALRDRARAAAAKRSGHALSAGYPVGRRRMGGAGDVL